MPGGAKFYVSARWAGHHANTVFAVSTATPAILRQARLGLPGPIAFTPDGATAFVINGGPALDQGTVVPVTTATDMFQPPFPVGANTAAIAVTRRWEGVTG
jgi:DNA-binding beta-propeller fold protein YncE